MRVERDKDNGRILRIYNASYNGSYPFTLGKMSICIEYIDDDVSARADKAVMLDNVIIPAIVDALSRGKIVVR